MRMLTLSRVLLFALAAGLLGGLLVTGFHWVITEPIIDRAIALEEQAAAEAEAQPGVEAHTHDDPIVSREFQKTGGLLLGYLIYGLTWGLFWTLVYYPLQPWLARLGPWRGPLLLAALFWWAIVVVPFIKYPANPPAVGDPATIGYRQTMYLTLLGTSAAGTALAVWLGARLARRQGWPVVPLVVACLLVVAVLLVLIMPANPDPITAPADLISDFRIRSFLGLALFWAGFGVAFAWLARRPVRQAAAARMASPSR